MFVPHKLRTNGLAAALLTALLVNASARAESSPSHRSLNMSAGALTPGADQAEPSPGVAEPVTTRRHPSWVTDAEAKMWPGFLTGLPGYDDFIMPVGNFVYFEDPFITTDLRLMYVWHDIPNRSVLRGGQIHLIAAQIRVALTERLALIATKDGYSWVDTHITSAGDGFNDFAFGLKYAIYSNPSEHMLLSGGMRWELSNGSSDALQGGAQELSPFLAFAKGWEQWHFLGTINGRIPTNRRLGNYSVTWHMHVDYKLTDTFRPLIELHGIHWLSNGTRLPISEDLLDVGSLGSSRAAGRDFFSAGVGFRWQVRDDISFGMTYEFPLESPSSHLLAQRVTINTVISF